MLRIPPPNYYCDSNFFFDFENTVIFFLFRMDVDQPSSEIGQLGQSELDGVGRSGLGVSEFDLSSPLNYGTPSSNNPLSSQGKNPIFFL